MKEKNVMLYGFKTDDVFEQPFEIESFETQEEAKKAGEKLVKEGKIYDFDTYVI